MSKLKVVLINPPPLAVVEPWYDRPELARIALAYLAAYLREAGDYDITIIDAKYSRLNFQEVLRDVVELCPDVVGLTAFTNEIKPAAYQAALIKEQLPSTRMVIGGVHVTALPVKTLEEFTSFDVGVFGEGERTFHELCQAIGDGATLDGIPGLVYRVGDNVIQAPLRERILDQDTIPHPAWDLTPPAAYFWVQTMRGCPFNCVFCMNHNGRVARTRSVENVIEELEMLIHRYGAKFVRFGDELFTVNMTRARELADAMIAKRMGEKIRWQCQTHVGFVDADLLRAMKQAGCQLVEMGIETGDEAKLRTMGKGTTMEMILAARDAANEAEMPFGTLFIIGHPDETTESIKRTVAMAVRMNPTIPYFGIMCPYPGTEVSRLAAAGEGGYRLLTTDWDDFNKQIGGAMEFAHLSRTQIERIQIWAYSSVFLRNFRLWGFLKFFWRFRSAALNLLLKVVFRHAAFTSILPKPPDYEEKLKGGKVEMEDLVSARREWESVQKQELVRTKKEARQLLQVVSAPNAK